MSARLSTIEHSPADGAWPEATWLSPQDLDRIRNEHIIGEMLGGRRPVQQFSPSGQSDARRTPVHKGRA